jgi:hypothetical protein
MMEWYVVREGKPLGPYSDFQFHRLAKDGAITPRYRLPAIYDRAEFVHEGGVMSYGVSSKDLSRCETRCKMQTHSGLCGYLGNPEAGSKKSLSGLFFPVCGLVLVLQGCATGPRVIDIGPPTNKVTSLPYPSNDHKVTLEAITSVMVSELHLPAPTASVTFYPSQASYEAGSLTTAQEDLARLRTELGPIANLLKEEDFLFAAKRSAVSSPAHARYRKILVNESRLSKISWAGQIRLLAHELTHSIEMDLVDGRPTASHQWIREGLAEWVGCKVGDRLGAESFAKGNESALDAIANRKHYQTFPSLSQLAVNSEWIIWSRTLGSPATYGQAFIAVDLLISEKGLPAVINYLRLFKKLNNREKNFTLAFGESTANFETKFTKHLDDLLRRYLRG